jgi:putative ABC transport system substrate-binding protein
MKRQIICIYRIIFFLLFSITALEVQAVGETIGVIMAEYTPYYRAIHESFVRGLKSEDMEAEIILQTPYPEEMAWINAARKVVAIDTDFIVTYGTPVVKAVLSETSEKPVVFAGVYDVGSLSTRGKKVTGITSKVSIAGLLKNLKGITNFSTLGIVYSSTNKETLDEANEAERLGEKFSFKSVKFNVIRQEDVSKIKGVDAIFITTSCKAMIWLDDIVKIARKQKIPTATLLGGGEERGIILTLYADPKEQGKEAANILARIIKGESPASIPIRSPKKIHLVINLKEATALDLKVPFDILTSATRIIK